MLTIHPHQDYCIYVILTKYQSNHVLRVSMLGLLLLPYNSKVVAIVSRVCVNQNKSWSINESIITTLKAAIYQVPANGGNYSLFAFQSIISYSRKKKDFF